MVAARRARPKRGWQIRCKRAIWASRPVRRPAHASSRFDRIAPRLSRRPVPHGGRRRASGELPAGASADPPRIRTAAHPGRRQGGGSMAEVAERHYLDERGLPAAASPVSRSPAAAMGARRGWCGWSRPGHPVPDAAGVAATLETLALADMAGADDLVLALVSGGASANWIAPAAGLDARGKAGGDAGAARVGRFDRRDQRGAQAPLAHQGRAAGRARLPGKVVAVGISDVPGDDPAVIGSGPTVPDPTTLADARAIVARYRLDLPEPVTRALADPANETPKPGDPIFAATSFALAIPPAEVFGASRTRCAPPATTAILLGTRDRGRGARGRRGPRAARARSRRSERPPRRDPLGRRAHRDAARQGSRRPQPGICAGAGAGAGRRQGWRRWPATPTAPTAAADGRRPGRGLRRRDHA